VAAEARKVQAPYMEIVNHFMARVAAGDLKAGDRLPSVRDIAAEWSVARNTAERAITKLKTDGIVQTAGAGGTLVTGRLAGENEEVVAIDLGAVEVSAAVVLHPSKSVARELGVTPGSAVVVIRYRR
jgi:DNA-binding transcriptional regulator YhcF (GntR family)